MVRIPAGTFRMGSGDDEITKVVRDLGGGELLPDEKDDSNPIAVSGL